MILVNGLPYLPYYADKIKDVESFFGHCSPRGFCMEETHEPIFDSIARIIRTEIDAPEILLERLIPDNLHPAVMYTPGTFSGVRPTRRLHIGLLDLLHRFSPPLCTGAQYCRDFYDVGRLVEHAILTTLVAAWAQNEALAPYVIHYTQRARYITKLQRNYIYNLVAQGTSNLPSPIDETLSDFFSETDSEYESESDSD